MSLEFFHDANVCRKVEGGGGGHDLAVEGKLRAIIVSNGASC